MRLQQSELRPVSQSAPGQNYLNSILEFVRIRNPQTPTPCNSAYALQTLRTMLSETYVGPPQSGAFVEHRPHNRRLLL